MTKELQLVFAAEGNGELTLSLSDPKEGLTLAEAQSAAAKIIPVLQTAEGASVTALKKAQIVTTTEEALA